MYIPCFSIKLLFLVEVLTSRYISKTGHYWPVLSTVPLTLWYVLCAKVFQRYKTYQILPFFLIPWKIVFEKSFLPCDLKYIHYILF